MARSCSAGGSVWETSRAGSMTSHGSRAVASVSSTLWGKGGFWREVKNDGSGGAQRLRNYFTLFFLVHAIRSGRRTGRRLTTDVAQSRRIPQQFFQTLAHERPTTHVARLFLRPDKLRRAFVLGQQLAYAAQRKRIELFHAHDCHAQVATLLTSFDQIVVNLAAAQDDFADRGRVGDLHVVNDRLKTAAGEILNARSCRR